MQYLNHDFFSNFEGSVDSGDVELSLDLWVNEVSDLIVSDTKKIIDLLNKTNVSASLDDSYEELADKILNNVGDNKKLNRGISFLIGEQNNLIKKESNNWRQVIDKISSTYEVLLSKFLTVPSLKSSVKNDIMQHIKSKAKSGIDGSDGKLIFKQETPLEVKKKRKKVFFWVLGGIAVLSIVGFGIYFYRKNKKIDVPNLGDGGSLLNSGNIQNPIVAPSVSIPNTVASNNVTSSMI